MDLTLMLHLAAGVGALTMGGGVLLREPSRLRNRHFALLCGALALWNLGQVGQFAAGPNAELAWRLAYLLGSCAAAPLGLQFVLVLAGTDGASRKRRMLPAWTLAGSLWLLAATPLYGSPRAWPLAAMGVLGGILVTALIVLGRHAIALPPGPERRAHLLVFWGGVVGVLGGVSDFVPRDDSGWLRVGPLALVIFLLVVCSVIVRHRFLDVDVFLIRAVALIAGATVVALVFLAVIGGFGAGFLVLFLTSALVLAAAGPASRRILTGARSLLSPEDPVPRALIEISRRLPSAADRSQVWAVVEDGRRLLGGDVWVDVHLRRRGQDRFERAHRAGGPPDAVSFPTEDPDPLADWLGKEQAPVTRRYLEQEGRESGSERRKLAVRALRRLDGLGLRLVVPLLRGERIAGWIGLGGGLGERYVTAEVATALLAVGNQTLASLDRIEAIEAARRKEALAAVGELAAGLAHEVRNPVAAIRGAAQALGPDATERQSAEMLEVIQDETERLGRFVGEFLEYARPGSPRCEPVRLAEMARQSLERLRMAGVELEASVAERGDPPPVPGDPDQIRRAFDNLIRNAAEATGEDGRLRIEVEEDGEGRVAARFEDDGPGIPPEEIPMLFQPFHSTKPGGTGLGLALVYRIVDAHRGEIRVDGRPGVGAVFTVFLPFQRGAERPDR